MQAFDLWLRNLDAQESAQIFRFGLDNFREAQSEEELKKMLQERIQKENEKEKDNYIKKLSGSRLATFKSLGGKKWDGYVHAETLWDFRRLLDKYEEVNTLDVETKKLFDSLGGVKWEGFTRAKNSTALCEAIAFVKKETEWPGWIERLEPKQREMFETLGGIEWEGFKESAYEHYFRILLDENIKKVESETWIEHLSKIERDWFERLGGAEWEGFDESETEEELVDAIHKVIDETTTVMDDIAEDYPLACEQHIKLLESGLSEPQLEYALKAIEALETLEHREGKDLLFLLEEHPRFGEVKSSFVFHVMERNDFVNSFGINASTYTDFVNADGYLDDIYETSSVDDICDYANQQFEEGKMTQEDFDDFKKELKKVFCEFPSLKHE